MKSGQKYLFRFFFLMLTACAAYAQVEDAIQATLAQAKILPLNHVIKKSIDEEPACTEAVSAPQGNELSLLQERCKKLCAYMVKEAPKLGLSFDDVNQLKAAASKLSSSDGQPEAAAAFLRSAINIIAPEATQSTAEAPSLEMLSKDMDVLKDALRNKLTPAIESELIKQEEQKSVPEAQKVEENVFLTLQNRCKNLCAYVCKEAKALDLNPAQVEKLQTAANLLSSEGPETAFAFIRSAMEILAPATTQSSDKMPSLEALFKDLENLKSAIANKMSHYKPADVEDSKTVKSEDVKADLTMPERVEMLYNYVSKKASMFNLSEEQAAELTKHKQSISPDMSAEALLSLLQYLSQSISIVLPHKQSIDSADSYVLECVNFIKHRILQISDNLDAPFGPGTANGGASEEIDFIKKVTKEIIEIVSSHLLPAVQQILNKEQSYLVGEKHNQTPIFDEVRKIRGILRTKSEKLNSKTEPISIEMLAEYVAEVQQQVTFLRNLLKKRMTVMVPMPAKQIKRR